MTAPTPPAEPMMQWAREEADASMRMLATVLLVVAVVLAVALGFLVGFIARAVTL